MGGRQRNGRHVPTICKGVIVLPKIRTDPVIRRISLKTPASVRTSPLPAPTRNTAATLSKNATNALLRRIKGLKIERIQTRHRTKNNKDVSICALENRICYSPDTHNFIEWRQTLRQRQDGQVDDSANGRIVMEGNKWVHLEAVKQDLDHHQSRGFKLLGRVDPEVGKTAISRKMREGGK